MEQPRHHPFPDDKEQSDDQHGTDRGLGNTSPSPPSELKNPIKGSGYRDVLKISIPVAF